MKQQLLEMQADLFNALSHPLRLKILEKLRAGACCVCKIIPYVGGEQSNVSHHLAILRKAGVVSCEKKGLEVWYEVTDHRIFKIIDLMNKCILVNLKMNREILQSLSRSMK
jgi:ArsR family transcriptional regulator